MTKLNGHLREILLAGIIYSCLTATLAAAARAPAPGPDMYASAPGPDVYAAPGPDTYAPASGPAVSSSSDAWKESSWTDAHATFYGGEDASGTMGGSCGYGNLYSTGYGTATTALSNALFNNGLTCGACFQLVCKVAETTWCYPGRSITVTATNQCPPGSFGGWCDPPKVHFDLSYMMFTQLAQAIGGVVPVQYKRVPCVKQGGVRFTVNGNPWFVLTLITNVAGSGNVKAVSIKGDGNTDWCQAVQNWGANWEVSSHPELVGTSLRYLVTLGNGSVRQFDDVAPPNWAFDQTYEAPSNFY